MEDKKEINDSFDEVIIHKPKPIRLCTQKKNKLSGSVKSTSSTSSNSEKSQMQIDSEESKMKLINFNDITIDEINNDFSMFEQYLDEEECHDELWNILNNSSEKNNSDSNYRNYPKIKRCKNNYRQKTTEIMEKCDMDEFFNEFNNMLTEQRNEN